MEQLRKHFDRGLDINKLLTDDEVVTEDQLLVCEVCYYYRVHISMLPCQLDEATA